MKTKQYSLLALVLLALIVSSAPVLAAGLTPFGFVAIPLGDQTRQEMKVGFVNPYSVSLYRLRNERNELIINQDDWERAKTIMEEPIGFTYGTDLVCKVPNDLWVIASFTPNNLPGTGHTAIVRWGAGFSVGELMSMARIYGPNDIRPLPRDRRKAQQESADPGYEADCHKTGPTFLAAVPTNCLPENMTTTLVMDIFGPKGKTYTRWAFWTSVHTDKGPVQSPLAIARLIAPREWVDHAPGDEILRSCTGLETPWLVKDKPDETGQTSTTTTTTTSSTQPEPDKPRGGLNLIWEAPETPAGAPPPQTEDQRGVDVSGTGTPAQAESLTIAPEDFRKIEILDRENNDQWVISRSQPIYVFFSRNLRPGEQFEYGMSYTGRDGQIHWTGDTEGNPFPVPASEVIVNHFLLRFDNKSTVAPGEHTLFIRVVGPNGVLAQTTKSIIVKEDDPR